MAKTYYDYLRQELGELIEQLQLPELYKHSLKHRWLDQVVWADKKASECRCWHYRLRLTTIIGSVILPALVGINFQVEKIHPSVRNWFPYIPFTLSQIIAVSAAIEEFYRFGDRWRDYRQMAEDLKAEGWNYLQLSGPYQNTPASTEHQPVPEPIKVAPPKTDRSNARRATHVHNYSMFASRVESIIKNDVQNYISELVKQQTKQQQDVEKYLATAQGVTENQTLFAPPQTNSGSNGFSKAATTQSMTENQPPLASPQTHASANGFASTAPMLPVYVTARDLAEVPPLQPRLEAQPVRQGMAPPAAIAIAPPEQPSALNFNEAILAAAHSLRGMSTADGPDGGNNACAWSVNKVLQKANIPPLGENPNYVPSLLEALKQRGKLVSPQEAEAGDLVIAYEEAHIGIALTAGCSRVLSNSSSRACFVWESDVDFDGYYGGSSTIYRLLR
ncbi:DUF4231 domain-containing protein [Desertifilum sp. FACHB-1129]|uniref:DUF4231 domain-containing protein n=1 Tax=Desertifilum tharense IPPAS B-1220 TaxID=1781255 RepID=A0A1E5QKY5_9CYAN|nr:MULTISPECIES: DUF4231 domain-containing protein [Desertifilum]MDA0211721.1 DUF4231 domain-containing protein [Cyanobacteria bacterium FC1]MBD2311951.1 DUF4231 domain-containing protein [Desertifilum sp. FACHB-1129]MBD2322403.1 DUF4231 domain-containing protein [Desertifilum sp. FACHB-866]MBD2332566.1 DUF4231 domain-containing protein [Desertifilum sp. FACHB-868]OEJ75349.1 hypothetical protein BH720_10155 [Desertifilum tharense IPPAS B-1220]